MKSSVLLFEPHFPALKLRGRLVWVSVEPLEHAVSVDEVVIMFDKIFQHRCVQYKKIQATANQVILLLPSNLMSFCQ